MQSALIFLLKTLADLYLLTFLLRFILQWARASYYNPLAQFVFKVTNPLVVPARRVLPSVRGFDAPTLVVLIVLEVLVTFALTRLVGVTGPVPIPALLLYSLFRLISLALWFYMGAILIYVLLSWFGDRRGNPMSVMLGELVEPVLRPARRLLPPIGGLDLSPLIVLLLLQAATIALPIPAYLR